MLAPRSPTPDWIQASPRWIDRALAHALARPSGGWYVLGASRDFETLPKKVEALGKTFVVWRGRATQGSEEQLWVAPDVCPHMGASLAEGRVCDGRLVCPWHGLALGPEGHGKWKPLPVHDDRVLVWARLDTQGELTDKPVITARPELYLDAVLRREARCEPRDVLANRLDPWHGVHFHPHSFRTLNVLEQKEDEITVRVSYRLMGRFAVEVDARFHCPEPRTIVMTIVRGEGAGSVVETHATPLGPGRTAIIEATLASSDRSGFRMALPLSGVLRPWIRRAAEKLWVEDAAYAERLFSLRQANGDSGA